MAKAVGLTDALRSELDAARRISIEAGEIVLGYFGRGIPVDMKGWADPVTAADRAAEAHIRAQLSQRFPADGIHGEEEGMLGGSSGRVWIVDPLDGTANFAGGMPVFAVCLTLAGPDGAPLLNVTHDPNRNETFVAVKGSGATLNGDVIHVRRGADLASALIHLAFPRDHQAWARSIELTRRVTAQAPHARNIGSSALAQAYVACGRLHAHIRVSAGEFDIVGGNLMIEEAGGIVTDLHGRPFRDPSEGLLAAGAEIHPVVLGLGLAHVFDH